MEAAQMLTAQQIVRECQQLAHAAEQVPQQHTEPEHQLRLAEPVTQPLTKVSESEYERRDSATPARTGAAADTSAQEKTIVRDAELTELGQSILAFERQWWKWPGAKERAIRELFDLSPSRYYQLLNALVEQPAARRYDPMLIKRLRRVRADAQPARRLGSEWPR